MRKALLISIFILFGFFTNGWAQQTELPNPGLTPDSPFYLLEEVAEEIGTFFTFGDIKKAERYATLATERIAELKAMVEKGKSEAAEKALVRYQKQLENSLTRINKAEEKGKDVSKVAEIVSEGTGRHFIVLDQVLERCPDKAKQAVLKAKEASMKGQRSALKALAKQDPEKATKINLKMAENRLEKAKKKAEKKETEEVKKVIEEFKDQEEFEKEILKIAQNSGKDVSSLLQLSKEATTSHLKTLSEVYKKVSPEAKPAIEKAMEASVKSYENNVETFKEKEASDKSLQEVVIPEEVPQEVKKKIQKETNKEAKEGLKKQQTPLPIAKPEKMESGERLEKRMGE